MKLLEEQDVVPLNDENRALLQQALQLVIESQEECPVCMEPLTDPVITHCKRTSIRGVYSLFQVVSVVLHATETTILLPNTYPIR